MADQSSNTKGKWLVIAMLAIAIVAAVIGIWKRGLRPMSPDAQRAATQRAVTR